MKDIARIELGRAAIFFDRRVRQGSDRGAGPYSRCQARTRSTCSKHVKDKIEELSKRFPKGIEYGLHYDTTRFVRAAKRDVIITLSEALALVVLVVFIFLQKLAHHADSYHRDPGPR